jgi:hypothetical protein
VEPVGNAIEDEGEQLAHDFERLVIVLVDCHLEIEPSEFTQVPVRVGVLGSEYWSNLEHSIKPTASGDHLLVELRALRQTRRLIKILELEHVGAAFRGSADQFGGVDLNELLGNKILTEQLAHTGLNTEDCLRANIQSSGVNGRS